MEIKNEKCSSSKHSEINAVSYCPECKKYFCNKCQNFHSEVDEHKIINLNSFFLLSTNNLPHHIYQRSLQIHQFPHYI